MNHRKFEKIFNDLFLQSLKTQLVNGLDIGITEPLYTPVTASSHARIIYAHGFLSSALHEVAHWCYAGRERRLLEDYGYWYAGEMRNQQEQNAFEQVELIPQTYELILSEACGLDFQVSLDNFNPKVQLDREAFYQQVISMAQQKKNNGLPDRLQLLVDALGQS